jgi:site-specific recombinase XerD
MFQNPVEQGTINFLNNQDEYLELWIEKFLIDRKIEGFTAGTLRFYQIKLSLLVQFCKSQSVTNIRQIDTNLIRGLLLWLEQTGHNPGGRNAVYRAAKTFIRWWSRETDPENWKDPFIKIKLPKLAIDPLTPVELDTVKALIETCNANQLIGARDKAIILFLIDTGVRANELLSIGRADIDLILGAVIIRLGKGRKPRSVFIGKSTRRAIKAYLRLAPSSNRVLWASMDGEQLTYWGLKSMIVRRSTMAKVKPPKLHDFRRAFALGMLRSGVDVYTLQRLMGHADLQVLRRYLAQNDNDLAEAHRRAGLADRL